MAWLLVAAATSKIGTAFLRRAEGLKFRALKSGESRSRALKVARGMGVTLRRVLVVPAGKAHLTNAYGMSSAIAVTDNLGKFLDDPELEFVIAHEVAHVKLRHLRFSLVVTIATFSFVATLVFLLASQTNNLRPLFQLIAMFATSGDILLFATVRVRCRPGSDRVHWCS
jgi:Zn-dependent protease with chaperone function